MTWARFDDKINNHPKIIEAGPLADLLYRRAIVYCAQYLTDGRIHCNAVTQLVDWSSSGVHITVGGACDGMVSFSDEPNNTILADTLVRVGLMSMDGDYYVIHDFLEYNPRRADVEAEREKTKSRVAKHRENKCNAVTTPLVTPKKRKRNAAVTVPPYPSPLREEGGNVDARAPDVQQHPPFIKIPLKDGTEHPVTVHDVAEWVEAYPDVDVAQQLRNIRQWNLSKTDRRKTKSGIRGHITTWLAGEQEKAAAAGAKAEPTLLPYQEFFKDQKPPAPLDHEIVPPWEQVKQNAAS